MYTSTSRTTTPRRTFHISNHFDIPRGALRGAEYGKEVADHTEWTTAADLKKLRYYFRTHNNSHVRSVAMKAVNLDNREIVTILMKGDEEIEDVSTKGH